MRRAVIGIALAVLLATVSAAAMLPVGVEPWEMAPGVLDSSAQAPQNDMIGDAAGDGLDSSASPQNDMDGGAAAAYSDGEINEIANVVNGEVGGICGTVCLTYADGSQLWADASVLRSIHARVVDNQVRSSMFPATVDGCVRQCWSPAYAGTGWRESSQWQSCREEVLAAVVSGHYGIPDNVFAATCDSAFCQWYPGWYLWARVDWDTGWYSGTFYYYCYGG